MSDRVKTIVHKGEKIIYVNFSNLPPSGHVEVINQQLAYTLNQPDKHVLFLINLTNSRLSEEAKDASDRLRHRLNDQGYHFKLSIYGVSGLQRLIIKRREGTYFAKNEEDAKNWLVSQEVNSY